jgi:cob(I)alamin adenosyltransferase
LVKLNKIYTRTGDDGTTGLVDGARAGKDSPRMAAIGDVDEANSCIGAAALHAEGALHAQLTMIQNDMFDLGADLATPVEFGSGDFEPGEMTLRIVQGQIDRLEAEIDAMNADMTPLSSFILPGGSALAGALHIARAVTRRAERAAVHAVRDVPINPKALVYLNRLSDWLFVAARYANDKGAGDVLWVPGGSR